MKKVETAKLIEKNGASSSDVFFGFPMKSVNFFWFSDEIRLLALKLILDRKYSEKLKLPN